MPAVPRSALSTYPGRSWELKGPYSPTKWSVVTRLEVWRQPVRCISVIRWPT